MSIPDELMEQYHRYATGPASEALALDPGRPAVESKRALARAVVERYHGAGAGAEAEAEFDRVFKSGATPTDVAEHDAQSLADKADGDGRVRVSSLLASTGLARSGKDGKRLIEQGAVRCDGEAVTDVDASVALADLPGTVWRAGKRRWARFR
jgi:tyrosyl-tRNA synthetase